MARRPIFKQRDLERALRAATKTGIEVKSIEIGKDGKIVITCGGAVPQTLIDELDRNLEAFDLRTGQKEKS